MCAGVFSHPRRAGRHGVRVVPRVPGGRGAALAANPKRAAALAMLQSLHLPEDARSAKIVADARKTIGTNGTSFANYLQFRVSELKLQSQRVAAAFWISEIVLGSVAGTWILAIGPGGRVGGTPPAR